jgi:ABC-type molybdate transport system substrate-binding protein
MQTGVLWVESTKQIQPLTFLPKTSLGAAVTHVQLGNADAFFVWVNVLPVLWLGAGNIWAFHFSASWSTTDPIIKLCVPPFMSSELCIGAWETNQLARQAGVNFLNRMLEDADFKKKIDTDVYRDFCLYERLTGGCLETGSPVTPDRLAN